MGRYVHFLSNCSTIVNSNDAKFKINDVGSIVAYTLRWFTPLREVELCGHATLATAFILFDLKKHSDTIENIIIFNTKFKGTLDTSINWNTQLITPISNYFCFLESKSS